MDIITNLSQVKLSQTVATIGFFDGVHLGHRSLIEQVVKIAHELKQPSLIVTFSEHPRKVLAADYQPELLNTLNEKLCLLAKCNPDYCYTLKFNKEMAKLTYQEFMRVYLKDKLHVSTLVVGYDHHFGCNAPSCFEEYKEYGKSIGMDVIQADKYVLDGESVSSSAVRFCLQVGNVEKAAHLLGYAYSLEGKVIAGSHLGHRFGFPTANMDIQKFHKMMPMDGAYAVKVEVNNQTFAGMAYIGRRPTIDREGRRSFEVHILNFSNDIYNEPLHVEFIRRLRAEKHFDTVDGLMEQLKKDMAKVEQILDV